MRADNGVPLLLEIGWSGTLTAGGAISTVGMIEFPGS